MRLAINAVKGGEKILRVANWYNVPRQTLQDTISGRVIHRSNPGPKPYLSHAEENELTEFLVDTAKGYEPDSNEALLCKTHGDNADPIRIALRV